jgi:hypothetical protein
MTPCSRRHAHLWEASVSCLLLIMARSVWRLVRISSCQTVGMEFWVASLVLEHQHAILISVCVHLISVRVVLKPTSVYFLTNGLSQKHFAQVINIHMFISKIKNIHLIHLSLYQALNKILWKLIFNSGQFDICNVIHLLTFVYLQQWNFDTIEVCKIQGGPRESSPPSILQGSLATVLISVLMLCYGPGLLFCGPPKSSPGL